MKESAIPGPVGFRSTIGVVEDWPLPIRARRERRDHPPLSRSSPSIESCRQRQLPSAMDSMLATRPSLVSTERHSRESAFHQVVNDEFPDL